MKKLLFLVLIIVSCNNSNEKPYHNYETRFEISEGTETATYQETIEYYTKLANDYSEISIETIGETDSGKPLHIVTLNANANSFDFEKLKKDNRILLINNGIHPGESDGIDATMMLFRDIVQGVIKAPKNTIIVTIPIYNVGEVLIEIQVHALTKMVQNHMVLEVMHVIMTLIVILLNQILKTRKHLLRFFIWYNLTFLLIIMLVTVQITNTH